MSFESGALLSIREQQDVMLAIMKSVHAYCMKNNIRYVLLYGSLLGAVRHHGFIPWDNDMDIGIPRPDYDRLVGLLNSGDRIGEHLYHLHYTSDPSFRYQIMRICDDRTTVRPEYIRTQPERMGVWVDIFPIDGIPPKTIAGWFRRFRLWMNKKIQIADRYAIKGKKNPANLAGNLICIIFPHAEKRLYLVDKILRATPFEQCALVADMEDRDGNNMYLEKEDFDSPCTMPFEDAELLCPKGWDAYLRRLYGDYMQLPPEEKRLTHETGCRWV